METASVIVPSLGRPNSLKRCLNSLKNQTFKDFKVHVINDVAPLSVCRNKGAKLAKGEYLIFIDDDTFCPPEWLGNLISTFSGFTIGGASGPAIITEEFRKNRDLFKHKFLKRMLYDKFFCEGKQDLPGHIMPSGAFTTGSSDEDCDYSGDVQFVEACNMAFSREAFEKVGGFSNEYKGVGEWQEPDICFKMRKLNYRILFNPDAKLYHEPSQSGVYKKRFKEAKIRYENYLTFSRKWIKPHWKHSLFKLFMKTYYWRTYAR